MARVIAFVDRFHWLWLVLAAPLLIFPAPARAPVLFVVPLVWLAGWLARPLAPLARTPLNAPLLALMAMVLVSVLVTPDPAFSLTKVSNVVLGIGVFFAVARVGQRPTGFRWSLALFVLIGAGVAAVSLLGTVWGTKIGFLAPITSILVPRLMGLPGAEEGFNPNQVAGALLWVAPVLVWLLLQPAPVFFPRRDTKGHEGSFFVSLRVLRGFPILEKLLLGLGAVLVLGVLLLTQSRGAYIGLVLALAGAAWLWLPRRWRWVATGVAALAAVAVIVVAWAPGSAGGLQEALFSAPAAADASSVPTTFEARVEIWSRALYGIQDFPFTGMGMNMFRRVVHVLYPLFLISPEIDIGHAHNEFLQAALDLGIPGLIAFGSLLVVVIWMLRRVWAACDGQRVFDPRLCRALVLGLGGGLFGHLAYGMTDAVALGAKPGVLFWILLGLIAGAFALVQNTGLPGYNSTVSVNQEHQNGKSST